MADIERYLAAVDDIVAERKRQTEAEGWSTEHDNQYTQGELARAAMAYCQAASFGSFDTSALAGHPPHYWPWETAWWKPKNCRRDLVRAAALIVAEIERIDRAAPTPKEPKL